MIDQDKLDREYVEGLEKTIEQLGSQLAAAQRGIDRYREENLELQEVVESLERDREHLMTRNVAMQGAIDQATNILNRAMWTASARCRATEAER